MCAKKGNINKKKKAHVFIITLNVLIILSVALLSFFFNSQIRQRFIYRSQRRYQAKLNAFSGLNIVRQKIMQKHISHFPFKEEFILYGDRTNLARVKIEYITKKENKNGLFFDKIMKSNFLRITSVGKHKANMHKVIALLRIDKSKQKLIFCHNVSI
jgi:hypothetical protein